MEKYIVRYFHRWVISNYTYPWAGLGGLHLSVFITCLFPSSSSLSLASCRSFWERYPQECLQDLVFSWGCLHGETSVRTRREEECTVKGRAMIDHLETPRGPIIPGSLRISGGHALSLVGRQFWATCMAGKVQKTTYMGMEAGSMTLTHRPKRNQI